MVALFDRDRIAAYIPHRHANNLLDSVRIISDTELESVTAIQPQDPYGRDLFMHKQAAYTPRKLLESILVEIIALSTIILEGPVPDDKIVVFATITDFSYTDTVLSEALVAQVKTINKKKLFFKSQGIVKQNGETVAQASLMASVLDADEKSRRTQVTHQTALPESAFATTQVDKTQWHRDRDLVICDRIHYRGADRLVGSYAFKSDNKLIPGHFPSMPVMMGVLQWQSIPDLLMAAYRQNYQDNHKSSYKPGFYNCDAVLYNQNKDVISVITGCYVVLTDTHACILKTKRIAFKNRVLPGDDLYTDIVFKSGEIKE